MTVEQAISEISAMSPTDQIRIVQQIWNGLADNTSIEPTPAMKAELDRRWAKYEADPSSALTEEQFRDQMRVARGR